MTAVVPDVPGVHEHVRVSRHEVPQLEACEREQADGLHTEAPDDLVADHGLVEPLDPLPLELRREALTLAQEPAPARLGVLRVLHLLQGFLELAIRRQIQRRVVREHGDLRHGLSLLPPHHAAGLRLDPVPPRHRRQWDAIRWHLESPGLDLALALHLHLPAVAHLMREVLWEVAERLRSELQLARNALLHHPRRRVDRVAEEPVAGQLRAYDACNNGAGVDAHLELHLLGLDLHDLRSSNKEALQQRSVAEALILLLVLGEDPHGRDVLLAHRLDLCDLV
mmetsp:Transcript_4241/g.11278  ORF Transcript_4241/g.11278 Transcript_4241/m.11278 type:complete len:281 (+) Transcript_4241:1406-2248(+)